MYISAVRLMVGMPRPREVQHTADERTGAAVDDLQSGEEPEDADDEQVCLPGSLREPREPAEAVRLQLLDKFLQWNNNNEEPKPVPKCLQDEERCLLSTRMPAWLPENDDRFHHEKKAGLCLRLTSLRRNRQFFLRTTADAV